MFVAVPYTIYGWTPPALSLTEKIWLGGEVARVGRKAFTTSLKRRLSPPTRGSINKPFTFADVLRDAETPRSGNRTQSSPQMESVFIAVPLCLLFFGGCFWVIAETHHIGSFVVAILVVGPISIGSLLRMHHKVDRWVQSLINEYNNAVQNEQTKPVRGRRIEELRQLSSSAHPKGSEDTEEIARLRLRADQGEAAAQNALGLMYADGRGVKKNDHEAVEQFRRAAKQGYAPAQHNLGIAFERGRGIDKDEREAFGWYREAAEQGYAPAQSNLGVVYEIGIGVKKDEHEAFMWYRKAAEQGYAAAQRNLGAMYADGRGVEKNDRVALAWMVKAAEQGHARAQFNLGAMYETGRDAQKSMQDAIAWYNKAAQQGYSQAQARLKAMGSPTGPKQQVIRKKKS